MCIGNSRLSAYESEEFRIGISCIFSFCLLFTCVLFHSFDVKLFLLTLKSFPKLPPEAQLGNLQVIEEIKGIKKSLRMCPTRTFRDKKKNLALELRNVFFVLQEQGVAKEVYSLIRFHFKSDRGRLHRRLYFYFCPLEVSHFQQTSTYMPRVEVFASCLLCRGLERKQCWRRELIKPKSGHKSRL